MFGADDLDVFLADMGTPCVAGSVSFVALFDQPDELLDVTRANVHTREYLLTYKTSAVTLSRNQTVSVNGTAYTVREAPRQIGDGAFSRVLISKA